MSPSRKRSTNLWKSHGGRRARARSRRARLGIGIALIMPALIVVLFQGQRISELLSTSAGTTYDERTILDSLRVTDARRDWVNTLLWSERLGRIRPRDPAVLLARSTAWSNYALAQRPGRVIARPALRTSFERVACLRRAVGLMDSSAMSAGTPAQWLDAGERLAQLYETLGLPGDALIAHEAIKQRMPDEMGPALRAYWLRALFYDPVDPDTSAYHERMKGLGLR